MLTAEGHFDYKQGIISDHLISAEDCKTAAYLLMSCELKLK